MRTRVAARSPEALSLGPDLVVTAQQSFPPPTPCLFARRRVYFWYPGPLLCVISLHSGPLVSMEQLLRAELRTKTLRVFGSSGAGCISEGRAYDTDAGPVFVKVNRRTQVR